MASRTVVTKLTGHKTEAVYRRAAIVTKSDLREAGTKIAAAPGQATSQRSLDETSNTSSSCTSALSTPQPWTS